MNSLNGVMVVGLTGQTGAGKSTVSRLFTESGFCVIDADQIARAVVHKGSRCLLELTECFSDILLPNDEFHHVSLHYGGDSAADSLSFEDGSEVDFAGCSNAV